MSYIRLEKDADGIVELIFDQEGKDVNVMGDEYAEAMPKALDELEAMAGAIKGVYIRSGKPGQFFAGGDITLMLEMDLNPSPEEREEMFRGLLDAKEPLARLERLGVPIAVGINGPALGGGYEIALACHHRVALDSPKVKVLKVDINDEENFVKSLEGSDVCLNASVYYTNLPVMEACLKAGVHYTDMGGLFYGTREQLKLHDRFAAGGAD